MTKISLKDVYNHTSVRFETYKHSVSAQVGRGKGKGLSALKLGEKTSQKESKDWDILRYPPYQV